MAHRLELSLKDALNSTPLKDIDEMLVGVYNYVYEKSPKKVLRAGGCDTETQGMPRRR